MAGDALSPLHFQDVQTRHDLVVSQLPQLAAVCNQVSLWLAEGAHNLVVRFILGNGHCAVDEVANLVEKFLSLIHKLLGPQLLLLDLVVKGLRLGRLCRDVGLLILLFLGSHRFRDVAFLFAQAVEFVLG